MTVAYDIILKGNSLRLEDGFLGLANAVLVRGPDGPLLFDTGHYGNRHALITGLKRHGLEPDDIRAVFLSHLHFDHCHNIDLFRCARVFVSRREWDYAAAPPPEDRFVPWLIQEQLRRHDLVLIEGDGRLCAGVRHVPAPGHTPGSMALLLDTAAKGPVVLAGDAIKYPREALSGRCDMTFDTDRAGRATIDRLLGLADTLVPGHFPEMVRRDGVWQWDDAARFALVIR